MGESSEEGTPQEEKSKELAARSYFGFDEDDEFMSDSEDEHEGEDQNSSGKSIVQKEETMNDAKGKGKATA